MLIVTGPTLFFLLSNINQSSQLKGNVALEMGALGHKNMNHYN